MQADFVQSRKMSFVRYCLKVFTKIYVAESENM